ncbi:DUF1850 domain-containing protein [Allorhizobium terrae]|uniref:DUF1850 domain-containing protein n=1 Tax=Allorhizobium terrae TaxID=1848972 RepID=A0A4S3ZPE7_9HYPH|nr:DUF1850 domain-containing protein [Allorhizobium terrae]THF47369.1 DUF1850 domain-containing protein [Allorhizobium terrae]
MSLCIAVGAKTMVIATTVFTLQWTHSVEKIDWREQWHIGSAGLQLTQASVKGSGAGMEPGDGAHLKDGWWTWTPKLAPIKQLSLAASGATGGGWHLCYADTCIELGKQAGQSAVLRPCP